MLRLASINAGAAVSFALIYMLAGARYLSQPAFWTALTVVFVAATAVWIRMEHHRSVRRDLLSRAGRITIGLVIPIFAVPVLVLMPLFFLQDQLPLETTITETIARVMFLLLTSLTLMIVMNIAAVAVLVAMAILDRLRA